MVSKSGKGSGGGQAPWWTELTADVLAEHCPSRGVLNDVTSRWGVLVLLALREGKLRFGDLRRMVGGISEKMLAQTLQKLENDGFVERYAYPVVPPHVEYHLTPLGVGIAKRIASLTRWIESRIPQILAARERTHKQRSSRQRHVAPL